FTYTAAMERDSTCVTFRCQASDPKEDVKFVSSYGTEAHAFLERLQCAPKLLYCGAIDDSSCSYSGMQMVVMEYIQGQTLSAAKAKDSIIDDGIEGKLRKALDTLHGGGFVFGDLRGPNIILPDDSRPVVFLDFDWAGKTGTARYPINLSSSVDWPLDAEGLGEIKPEHDLHMLQKIVEKYLV
ncbi:hypothetical protein B0H16DRAFT_1346392, partial [Mycena metata]